MKITKEELYNFLAEHGEEVSANENSVNFVGLDTVLERVNSYVCARLAMYSTKEVFDAKKVADEAMEDYFLNEFSRLVGGNNVVRD